MTAELDARRAGARRLNDKVCIVTGAGQGIGRATAKRLGQEGGKIIGGPRRSERNEDVKELRENDVDASHACR
jgi:NAD(P)-dependent dehydrogenase (short-subunit alcohol dehydrogenase family)